MVLPWSYRLATFVRRLKMVNEISLKAKATMQQNNTKQHIFFVFFRAFFSHLFLHLFLRLFLRLFFSIFFFASFFSSCLVTVFILFYASKYSVHNALPWSYRLATFVGRLKILIEYCSGIII